MEQNRFQWCLFNQDRSQQWVVRCDDFEEFVVAIQQVISLRHGVETVLTPDQARTDGLHHGRVEAPPQPQAPAASPQEEAAHVCPIHQRQMTLRTGKNGQQWYDHRWKEGTVWFQCNGERVKEN